jgi:two-component system cell cycle sensor histidine kinase/response regulator CckA
MDITLHRPVRILCLEDNDGDRELLEQTLVADGLNCNFRHAKSRQEFETALSQGPFDLIISDFSLPAYDGMTALATVRKLDGQTPFIFVSGTIGEDRAIESLKSGATDYVLKDRRERLVSAVRRALRESHERAERKRLEEQLRQAQKMEAIGQLASGVAHDFNNLLAVIKLNVDLAVMVDQKIDEQVRENLKQINTAVDRAAGLTRQLLAFSRKQAMRPQSVNLVEVMKNLKKMLDRIIGEDIALQCSHGRHLPYVHADVGMIEQVLLNLVVNARDAMPEGGDLVISTKKLRVNSEHIPPGGDFAAGDFICLRVSDTGCGIPPENLARIFEPFFTTKEAGKGTGLGLATVYGIVKQHGGWIRVSSRMGVGTIFRIFLPAIEPPASKGESLSGTQPGIRRGGQETILLVEDEMAVRSSTSKLLGGYGYRVIQAASGREALEIWRKQELNIDLLLTDVVMPGGVTGRELAEQLRLQKPALKVIFVSGYSSNVINKDTDFLQQENSHFMQKPYQVQVLLDTIRRCFNGAAVVVG